MLSTCRLFADDNSLQQSSYDMFDIEYKLYRDLQMLEAWLKIQSIKDLSCLFSKESYCTPTSFFQGDKLECVPVYRRLGSL